MYKPGGAIHVAGSEHVKTVCSPNASRLHRCQPDSEFNFNLSERANIIEQLDQHESTAKTST